MIRCNQCRHWKKDDVLAPGTGRCSHAPAAVRITVLPAGTMLAVVTSSQDTGVELLTRDTFGCTEGELR